MLEQNKEEENIKAVVEADEEQLQNQSEKVEIQDYEAKDKISFLDTFKANLIDIIATGVISIAALYIFDILLRATAGYYVKEKISMLAIFYLISSLLYTSIMESKSADTIGKRVSKIKIHK
ncbi:RDD family protein [Clostridium ganghwense]|uniref:RDD family protein n=1 Tax=Clostridium ganghwense TaxID=312089 RepID=A0ABT4CRU7_9CLOT|nr:RDD family protein [Clostridium ganghwense]MCY6371769.1 RDD family protein [Clostridium ganghwense]